MEEKQMQKKVNPNLKSCYTCGNDVARDAITCPHCGAQLRSSGAKVVAVFFLVISVLTMAYGALAVLARHNWQTLYYSLVIFLISLSIVGRK